jgi:hypothetical protein
MIANSSQNFKVLRPSLSIIGGRAFLLCGGGKLESTKGDSLIIDVDSSSGPVPISCENSDIFAKGGSIIIEDGACGTGVGAAYGGKFMKVGACGTGVGAAYGGKFMKVGTGKRKSSSGRGDISINMCDIPGIDAGGDIIIEGSACVIRVGATYGAEYSEVAANRQCFG